MPGTEIQEQIVCRNNPAPTAPNHWIVRKLLSAAIAFPAMNVHRDIRMLKLKHFDHHHAVYTIRRVSSRKSFLRLTAYEDLLSAGSNQYVRPGVRYEKNNP